MAENEDKGRKLNWQQACALLGCKKSHFYNLVNSGRIPAQRYGELRGVWVYAQDCEAYLRVSKKFNVHHDNA